MGKILKAYEVRDDDEGHATIVFAANGATARREGANDLGIEWESVESCRRAPEFDQYAPGPVPQLVLIEHGWWFSCHHCGRSVSNDMAEELEYEGLDPDDFVPRLSDDRGIFCSERCECREHMRQRHRDEAEEALREVFEAKFPGAEIENLYVYGGRQRLHADGNDAVYFRFPGGEYSVRWDFGSEKCWVATADQDAFNAWRAGAV